MVDLLVNIDVDDLYRAIAFYTGAFDLQIGRRFGADGVELLGASAPIYLLVKSAGSRPSRASTQLRDYQRHWTPVHLDIVVTDIDAAVARAKAAGATLERVVQTSNWGKLALLADPFGNGFCLVEFLGRGYDEIATQGLQRSRQEVDMPIPNSPSDPITADIHWHSADPHLSGNFAPVGPELEVADLPVITGKIPSDLRGAYMRNGPNPLFEPISYTYPLDGDGMVHAVYFDNGSARYKNRFVRTRGLNVERRAGRAVYGGVFSLRDVDPKLTEPDGEPGPFKNGAFINVIEHGGRLLALGEASPAYEMTMELDTVGEWLAGSDSPISLGAHNRRHPVTGALFALQYSPDSRLVHFHHIDRFGRLARTFALTLAEPCMIHDFVLTEHHVVLVVGPAVFDMQAAFEGRSLLQWRPELGTRIAVVPLDGGTPVWIDAAPFFAFHFANGFECGGDIIIDYVEHERLHIGSGKGSDKGAGKPPTLHRLVLDIAGRRARNISIDDHVVEFPRINDRLGSMETRFIHVPARTDSLTSPNAPSATFNAILKVNPDSGVIAQHDFGNRIVGEPAFIPRPGGTGEDDGYLATFAYDPVTQTSDLVLLDAIHVEDEPVAVIRMPQRVPQGLHGNWIPK